MNYLQGVFAISLIAFILNTPFGWLRAYTKKFSIGWFLCIHAPIPVVALIRITTHTAWKFIPVFLVFSIAGQIVGARLKEKFRSS